MLQQRLLHICSSSACSSLPPAVYVCALTISVSIICSEDTHICSSQDTHICSSSACYAAPATYMQTHIYVAGAARPHRYVAAAPATQRLLHICSSAYYIYVCLHMSTQRLLHICVYMQRCVAGYIYVAYMQLHICSLLCSVCSYIYVACYAGYIYVHICAYIYAPTTYMQPTTYTYSTQRLLHICSLLRSACYIYVTAAPARPCRLQYMSLLTTSVSIIYSEDTHTCSSCYSSACYIYVAAAPARPCRLQCAYMCVLTIYLSSFTVCVSSFYCI